MTADTPGPLMRDLPILMYHHVLRSSAPEPHAIGVERLEKQLDILQAEGWRTLKLEDVLMGINGTRAWSKRSTWITFDDGYTSFLELAMPLLLARKMHATLFIVAGRIGGANDWDMARGLPRRQLLDDSGMHSAWKAGMDIGAHGWAHRDLTTCSLSDVSEEINGSRTELEQRLQRAVRAFAYPYGRYGDEHQARVAAAGYHIGVANRATTCAVMENPFAMRRICTQDCAAGFGFRLKLSRAYLRYRAWRRR